MGPKTFELVVGNQYYILDTQENQEVGQGLVARTYTISDKPDGEQWYGVSELEVEVSDTPFEEKQPFAELFQALADLREAQERPMPEIPEQSIESSTDEAVPSKDLELNTFIQSVDSSLKTEDYIHSLLATDGPGAYTSFEQGLFGQSLTDLIKQASFYNNVSDATGLINGGIWCHIKESERYTECGFTTFDEFIEGHKDTLFDGKRRSTVYDRISVYSKCRELGLSFKDFNSTGRTLSKIKAAIPLLESTETKEQALSDIRDPNVKVSDIQKQVSDVKARDQHKKLTGDSFDEPLVYFRLGLSPSAMDMLAQTCQMLASIDDLDQTVYGDLRETNPVTLGQFFSAQLEQLLVMKSEMNVAGGLKLEDLLELIEYKMNNKVKLSVQYL